MKCDARFILIGDHPSDPTLPDQQKLQLILIIEPRMLQTSALKQKLQELFQVESFLKKCQGRLILKKKISGVECRVRK